MLLYFYEVCFPSFFLYILTGVGSGGGKDGVILPKVSRKRALLASLVHSLSLSLVNLA